MKWNEIYEYPTSTRALIKGARHYTIDGQRKLPSVTTILSATQSEEKKASLAKWRQNVGENEAEQIKNTAARRGTAMHSCLESYINGIKTGKMSLDLTDIGREAMYMASQVIMHGLGSMEEIWGSEVTLYYPDLYAGATDLCGIYNDQPSIVDFKQSNKPKREEWIEDYFIQLAAYSLAHDHIYDTNTTQGVVLMCTPQGEFQRFTVDGQRFVDFKIKWLERLDVYYKTHTTDAT